nr:type II secretion system protein GspK [uncultured Rhodopila sp.]
MPSQGVARSRRQSGFALLIVLWTVGFLALLGTQLVAAGRSDTRLADNLKQEAVLRAAADGAVAHVMFAMQAAHDPGSRFGGAAQSMRIGRTAVLVRIENEADRVNLNTASLALLRALMIEVGAPPAQAERLAAAILDWRTSGVKARPGGAKAPEYRAAGLAFGPPGNPFQSVDELADVLGMTPALFERLAPHVTVLTDSDPDMTTRDPIVALALTDAAGVAEDALTAQQTAEDIVRISVTALGRDAARYTEEVVAAADFPSGTPRVNILLRQRVTGAVNGIRIAGVF